MHLHFAYLLSLINHVVLCYVSAYIFPCCYVSEYGRILDQLARIRDSAVPILISAELTPCGSSPCLELRLRLVIASAATSL